MNANLVYSILSDAVRRGASIGKYNFRERYVQGSAFVDGAVRGITADYNVSDRGVNVTSLTTNRFGERRTYILKDVYIAADSAIGELLIRG